MFKSRLMMTALFTPFLFLTASLSSAQSSRAVMEGVKTSNNTVFVDTTNIRFGIGISSPTKRLEVNGTGQVSDFFGVGKATTNIIGEKLTVNGYVGVKQPGADAYGFAAMSRDNDSFVRMGSNGSEGIIGETYKTLNGYLPLSFQTSDVDRITILASGNVGIGTTSPAQKLEVMGNSPTPVIITNTLTGTTNYLTILDSPGISNSNQTYIGYDPGTSFSGFPQAGTFIENGHAGTGALYPISIGTYDATSLFLITNHGNRLTILSGGNVGIGTINPGSILDVNGTIRQTGAVSCTYGAVTDSNGGFTSCAATPVLAANAYSLVQTNSPSASTTTAFSGLASNTFYCIDYSMIQNTSAGILQINLNGDVGAHYTWNSILLSGAASLADGITNDNQCILQYRSQGVAVGEESFGHICFYYHSAAGNLDVFWQSQFFYGTTPASTTGGCKWAVQADLNRVELKTSAGTFSGKVSMFSFAP